MGATGRKRWWRFRSLTATLIVVGVVGGAICGVVFTLAEMSLGVAITLGRNESIDGGFAVLLVFAVILGAVGGTIIGALSGSASSALRLLVRLVAPGHIAQVVAVCIGSLVGGSIGSFLLFPALFAVDPLYVALGVGALSSFAFGREALIALKRDKAKVSAEVPDIRR